MAVTVAGLPKYVVLRSKYNNKYIHYLWNEKEFGQCCGDYKPLGCIRDVNPVSPFVKLEVVPSATVPSSFIHLRCSYNNNFLKLMRQDGLFWLSATAEVPEEDLKKETAESTLVHPLFEDNNTVQLVHVKTQLRVSIFNTDPDLSTSDYIADSVCVYDYHDDPTFRFEFKPWEYDEKMDAKDAEIVELKEKLAGWETYQEEMKAKQFEQLQNLNEVVAALKLLMDALEANEMDSRT